MASTRADDGRYGARRGHSPQLSEGWVANGYAQRPTGTDDGELSWCAPWRPEGAKTVTVGYVAAPGPLLCTPMLADTAAEAVDARTVQYLLKAALVLKEKEERKEEEMMDILRRFRADLPISDAEWEAWQAWRGFGSSSSAGKRKRKKRRKRKLPKSSSLVFLSSRSVPFLSTGPSSSAYWLVRIRRTVPRSRSLCSGWFCW